MSLQNQRRDQSKSNTQGLDQQKQSDEKRKKKKKEKNIEDIGESNRNHYKPKALFNKIKCVYTIVNYRNHYWT